MNDPRIVIVDYGLGNVFSVAHACAAQGMSASLSAEAAPLADADAVILPGVGALGDAMQALERLDLIEPLRAFAASGRPLVGICLGMQLLLSESLEFGRHAALDLIPGRVVPLGGEGTGVRAGLKVPHVGWQPIHPARGDEWGDPLLGGIPSDSHFYFCHSFYAEPDDPAVVSATSRFADLEYCCAISSGNVSGFQFHPERSAQNGLRIYENLRLQLE